MDNFTHNGFYIDVSNIVKDAKKYCGSPKSFHTDMTDFAKLAIGHYLEYGKFLGSRVKSGSDIFETYKERFIVGVWNTGTRDGYRIYYMIYKNNFIFCLVYIKAKCKIHNETVFFQKIMKERFLK
ncbi:hypothetical protein KGV52_01610 [Candidatus Gracilibacteria bacterium]|nr:hypothetical protein [Candidatus Gracilibacteria bacterium]